MKSTPIIINLLLLVTIFSCKKAEKEEPVWPLGDYWKGSQTYGTVQALRNGEVWEASGIAFHDGSELECGILIGTFDPIDSVERENLSFSYVPYTPGLFEVSKGKWISVNGSLQWVKVANRYALQYDDLVNTVFYPDTTKNNWIQIESIDSIQGIIKGKFDVTYRISPSGEEKTDYPREVHFSQGSFEVRVKH
jgi:hypothetical protein